MSILIENLKRHFAVATVALLGVVYSTSVLAVGTAPGVDIINSASVGYEVGGVPQPPVVSPPTSFEVDQLVDVLVAEADGAAVAVVPNETGAVARFTVTNRGNKVQDFRLTVTNETTTPWGDADTFDPVAACVTWIDADGDDLFDDLVDTNATYIDELTADDTSGDNTVSVFVVCDIPNQSSGDSATIRLLADAHEGDGIGSEGIEQAPFGGPANTDGVEIVLVDDGESFDDHAYLVGSVPTMGAAKASQVLSDPLLNVFPNALAIPGAIVEYSVTITNTGTVAATNVSVSDTLQSDLTFETGTYNTGAADVSITVGAAAPFFCIAETGGVDTNLDGCVLTGSVLTVAAAGMTADEVANAPDNVVVVRFQVSIN